jgi:hypothetical protein
MSSLHIQLSEDLRSKLEARAAEGGHATVQAYVEALVRADLMTGEELITPNPLSPFADADIEAVLLRRMENNNSGVEGTPSWAQW